MVAEQKEEGFIAAAKRVDAAIMDRVDRIYHGLMQDGAIGAFLRQGVNELATAFGSMTPESTVSEPGSIWHPLHSDIADAKRSHEGAGQESGSPALPSPSEIGRESKSSGSVHGEHQQDSKSLPSPSEIGREQRPSTTPEHEHGHEHGREM